MDKALVYETRDSEFDAKGNRYFLNLYYHSTRNSFFVLLLFGSRFRNQKEERRETNRVRIFPLFMKESEIQTNRDSLKL